MLNSESSAFDLAGQLSHDVACVTAADSSALCFYTFSLKSFSGSENPGYFFKVFSL